MAEKINSPADWVNLLQELLPLIGQKLGDIIDFIHFRAVCKRWRSATNLSDSPPPFPWLMQIKRDNESDDKHGIVFHRLSSCMTVSFPLAFPMIYNDHLRNEFLLEEYDETMKFIGWNGSPLDLKSDHLGRDVSHHDVLPLPPVGVLPKLLNFQLYDKNKQLHMTLRKLENIAYHKDLFYFVNTGDATCLCKILVCDDTAEESLTLFPCHLELPIDSSLEPKCCLISTTIGLLMVVKKYAPPDDDVRYEDFEFVIYNMEYRDKKLYWTKLSTIGDLMLFLDAYNNFALMASDYKAKSTYNNGFSGNCIYFITKLKGSPGSCSTQYLVVGYNMAEQKCFEVCSLGEESSSCDRRFCWFIPALY